MNSRLKIIPTSPIGLSPLLHVKRARAKKNGRRGWDATLDIEISFQILLSNARSVGERKGTITQPKTGAAQNADRKTVLKEKHVGNAGLISNHPIGDNAWL